MSGVEIAGLIGICVGLFLGWLGWGSELILLRTERDHWRREALRSRAFADRLLDDSR